MLKADADPHAQHVAAIHAANARHNPIGHVRPDDRGGARGEASSAGPTWNENTGQLQGPTWNENTGQWQ